MTQSFGCDRAAALLVLAVAASCMTLGARPGDGTPADPQSLAPTGEYPESLSHETPEISAPETVIAAPEGMSHPAVLALDAIPAVALNIGSVPESRSGTSRHANSPRRNRALPPIGYADRRSPGDTSG